MKFHANGRISAGLSGKEQVDILVRAAEGGAFDEFGRRYYDPDNEESVVPMARDALRAAEKLLGRPLLAEGFEQLEKFTSNVRVYEMESISYEGLRLVEAGYKDRREERLQRKAERRRARRKARRRR